MTEAPAAFCKQFSEDKLTPLEWKQVLDWSWSEIDDKLPDHLRVKLSEEQLYELNGRKSGVLVASKQPDPMDVAELEAWVMDYPFNNEPLDPQIRARVPEDMYLMACEERAEFRRSMLECMDSDPWDDYD